MCPPHHHRHFQWKIKVISIKLEPVILVANSSQSITEICCFKVVSPLKTIYNLLHSYVSLMQACLHFSFVMIYECNKVARRLMLVGR